MSTAKERILIVENDPEVSDLIARQSLRPLGYRVKIVPGASKAIREAARFSPDVVVVNIKLPGLSGKDLLVALSSQGLDMPVIVMAEEGMEDDVIQAFRLGAADYLRWPIREAEVVSAVEHALKQVRARRERELLAKKLKRTNQELKHRIRDLTTIINIGKAVTSTTDQRLLFNRIVDGAVYATDADKGWLYLRKGNGKSLVLSACKNLPKSIVSKLNQSWSDGISSLVAVSGETLAIHGKPLERFKVAQLGKAALVVPVKARKEIVGVLVVVREKPKPFNAGNQSMLEAVADYAAVSLVNARLFKAIDRRARSLQEIATASRESKNLKTDILRHVTHRLKAPLGVIDQRVRKIVDQDAGNLINEYKNALDDIQANLRRVNRVVTALSQLDEVNSSPEFVTVNLVDLARGATARFRDDAKEQAVNLVESLPSAPIFVMVDVERMAKVFDALLSNAIRFSGSGGEVTVRCSQNEDNEARVSIHDTGPGIDEEQRELVFRPFYQGGTDDSEKMGIGLTLAKEIIKAHGGKIWVDGHAASGSVFRFNLPLAETGETKSTDE
ncbi:MAG: ATP-binding protein [Chloroflexota bacterium]|nr:ATP-binding protein [Chloroflexota bacterium]